MLSEADIERYLRAHRVAYEAAVRDRVEAWIGLEEAQDVYARLASLYLSTGAENVRALAHDALGQLRSAGARYRELHAPARPYSTAAVLP